MSVASELKLLREQLERFEERLSTSRRDLINARVPDPEMPDPVPVACPVELQGPPSVADLVQEFVRNEMSRYAEDQDLGTFEQEDDFEEEDPQLLSMSGFEITDYDLEEEPVPEAAPAADPPVAADPPAAEATPPEQTQQ